MTFIAIEGVIGVGKTTLARLLHQQLGGTLLVEVFEENPFLRSFYQSRDHYAFQTQVFFLLNRYQQLREVKTAPQPLVSDYMFAKDALFAHLNIRGDELAMYDQVYNALAENIPQPDRIIYLRADTPILMNRIALRDRSYERNMDESYIESLRVAYEQFFANYTDRPVLTLDTNHLNIILQDDHREEVLKRVRSFIGEGPQQPSLPGLEGSVDYLPQAVDDPAESSRRLTDFQRFHTHLDQEKGFPTDLLFNFMLMQEEVGELAKALKRLWLSQTTDHRTKVREELADVLAYVLKIANYTGIDLEEAYLEKMAINKQRSWNIPNNFE